LTSIQENFMKRIAIATAVLAALSPTVAPAVEAHHQPTAGAAAGAPLAEGEVRKVDKDAKKITIKHGPIQSLDMPPMTMVFQVKDPAVLDKAKAGDKIRFTAEKAGGAYVVDHLEVVK
jgi:Cu/Ag efflux protein CusF